MADGGTDYTWTTAGETGIVHVRRIGSGSFGEVHELSFDTQLSTTLPVRISETAKADCLGSKRKHRKETDTTFRWPHT